MDTRTFFFLSLHMRYEGKYTSAGTAKYIRHKGIIPEQCTYYIYERVRF